MRPRRRRVARRAVATAAAMVMLAACGPTHHMSGPATTLTGPPITPYHGTGPAPSRNLVPATTYRIDAKGADRRRQAMLAYLATLPNARQLGPVTAGNEVQTSWCVPAGASYCLQAMKTQGQLGGPGLVVTIDGATYGQGQNPPTFGLDVSSQDIPATAGQLAVEFQYSEDGGGILGAGWQMEFVYLTPALRAAILDIEPLDYFDLSTIQAAVGNELDFSDAPGYTTGTRTNIGLSADAPTVLASLTRYFDSARVLRTRMIGREAQLLRRVTTEIDQGRVAKPVDCKATAGAPVCANGPLTRADRVRELARAKARIGANEAFVADHYQQMYALIDRALFWPSCQSCWS